MSYYEMEPEDYMDDGELHDDDEVRDCGNCCHLQLVGVNFGGFCGIDGHGVTLWQCCKQWEAIR